MLFRKFFRKSSGEREERLREFYDMEKVTLKEYEENHELLIERFNLTLDLPYKIYPLSSFDYILDREFGVLIMGIDRDIYEPKCMKHIDATIEYEYQGSPLNMFKEVFKEYKPPLIKDCDLRGEVLQRLYTMFLREVEVTILARSLYYLS